jgi:hypothetical protein
MAKPMASSHGWLMFLGIMAIISGVSMALTIVGILFAWLPIWCGVLLIQAAGRSKQAADTNNMAEFIVAQKKLKVYFIVTAASTIAMLVMMALAFTISTAAIVNFGNQFNSL